jgi:rhodanese-related sulfurtransferase
MSRPPRPRDWLRRAALQAAAIALAGGGFGLLANALHPMGLPLTLAEVPRPGVPTWVWRKVARVEPAEARRLAERKAVVVVDARDAQDYAAGHVAGSISLPYHQFTARYPEVAGELPRDRPLLIYCYGSSCGLSMRLAKRLLKEGYDDLTVVEGGIAAWERAGYPTTALKAER